MDVRELKAERIKKGKSARDMANAMGLTCDSYNKKEMGRIGFSPEQIIVVARELELDADMINRIFFDDRLPIGRMGHRGLTNEHIAMMAHDLGLDKDKVNIIFFEDGLPDGKSEKTV